MVAISVELYENFSGPTIQCHYYRSYQASMTSYFVLYSIHAGTALISIAGFFIRGVWMLQSSARLQLRWVRIAPHINDSILLLTAVALALITAQYPGPATWLNAKIIGLLIYIVLGVIALKRGKSKRVRSSAWCLALITYAYILAVAVTKDAFLSIF